ncbi:MAG: PIN domain nuclease, partial [Bryobacteraceae bacterium]
MENLLVIRILFVSLLVLAAYFLKPFGLSGPLAAAVGLASGAVIVVFEMRVKEISLKRLIGAAVGSVLGILGAYLMSLVLASAMEGSHSLPFVQVALLLWMTYVGLVVGASKGELLNLGSLGGIFGGEKAGKQSFKILDTSVIIDGRIADVAETGFLDGTLVIPQFVLRELQLVADSPDALKRNRGRRGLDILQRLQKMSHLSVQILEDDYPHVRDVDMKLI